LADVEGGFTAVLGRFQAAWSRKENGYSIGSETPQGNERRGGVELPCLVVGEVSGVALDEKDAMKGKGSGDVNVVVEGSVVKVNITGWRHTIVVS
jgi:hypothetical protein